MSKLNIKLEKGLQSYYQIIISLTEAQLQEYKDAALAEFAKTYKKDGFRPGKVPAHIVKQEVNEVYLEMDAMNDIVNDSIHKVIEEHKDIKFIGQPYDMDRKKEDKLDILSYKLDVYPEVEVLNDNWKSVKVDKIDDKLDKNELKEAIEGLKRQYATYVDADAISHHTVDRLKVIYMNNDSEEIFTKTLFIEHADKHDGGFHNLEGKKVGEIIQVPYTKDVPAKLQYTKEDQTPKTITMEVLRTQKEELPEFTEEKIKELFANENINNMKDLEERVEVVIKEQKYQNELINNVDKFVGLIAPSFKVQIPKSMIDSEFKNRYDAMGKRFGGVDKFEAAFADIPNGKDELEKRKAELLEISKTSLTKFFTLQKVTDLLEIKDIAWDKDMDVETKIYQHFHK
jgi:trigger factor